MGIRYILYRVYHIFLIKSRLIKIIFPARSSRVSLIPLEEWRRNGKPFFFQSREELTEFHLSEIKRKELISDYEKIKSGYLQYFNNEWINVGFPINWYHNPESGHEYDKNIHWAYVPDLSAKNGDIKYVWEKSRFSYFYTIIRYDQHLKNDSSSFVFELINDWIDKNPINLGPNYKCSQEISLRLFNWTFALYFYKNSPILTASLFDKILNSMRLQLIHVYRNIHFSRISVRNNHAITETLCLYLIPTLFLSFPEAKKYKAKGKKYFEEEIAYQIYEDGSYLQFSMNYHRVVVQLLTWAINISELNGERFSETTYERAKATRSFLWNHQDEITGKLPNYGANDGALFFKLNNEEFLVHSPQLNALNSALYKENLYENADFQEDAWWYSGGKVNNGSVKSVAREPLYNANIGGFYILRHQEYFAMLRCGNHKDRPQQADQNHLDIWYKGYNILRDNGSYKYNTEPDLINYFMGTASHNTVQIGNENQMLKGGRFIWFYWSQSHKVVTKNLASYSIIDATAKVYLSKNPNITHRRVVRQYHDEAKWEIEDFMVLDSYKSSEVFRQNWHISDHFYDLGFEIKSYNKSGEEINAKMTEVWNSQVYGEKKPSKCIVFENKEPYFITLIHKKG